MIIAPPPPPPCFNTGPRVVIAVGTPPDRTPRFGANRERKVALAKMDRTAQLLEDLTGYKIRFDCDSPVRIPLSPVADEGDDYYGKTSAEQDRDLAGYGTEDIDFLLLYDSTTGYQDVLSNQSTIDNDTSQGPQNQNNIGPGIALVYEWNRKIILHELTHTWGAVQVGAPHEDGYHHCNDGLDIMCYWAPNENGDPEVGAQGGRCPEIEYDCGGDDYFNPYPTPGTWLADNFNLATDSVWIEP